MTVSIGTEWAEVEWEYTGIGGTRCNLVAQPNTAAVIEWKWLTVGHNQKAQRPITWQEWLTNDGKSIIPGVETTSKWMGDAETPWADPDVKYNDTEKNYLICAWSKEKGVNVDDEGAWHPFPATIEAEAGNESNHVFVVHGKTADTEGDPSAWDNQFWIQSPKNWKPGEQVKISFRYKASMDGVTTNTQIHKQNPSDYKHWSAVGDVTFNTEWQTFEKQIAWPNEAADEGWSIAFNLNPKVKEAVDFYFDDLSWQSMVLDEGLFIAASNAAKGIEYDFDNATELVYDEAAQAYVATVGTAGKEDTWVNEVMISTIRGNDAAFKGATLKPTKAVVGGEDDWIDYAPGSLAKIKLPAAGVWTVSVDTENMQMNFIKVEGEENKEPVEIVTNTEVFVVKATERDFIKDDEHPEGTGAAWDNQFWIAANRTLSAGEVTVVEFDYFANKEAKTTTQCHKLGDDGKPCTYLHWKAIGDVNFTTEEQHFSKEFTVATEAEGMMSIVFNMAEIKEACDYTIKNVKWYVKDESLNGENKTMENLISGAGVENFWVKVDKSVPYKYGSDTGINSVVNNGTVSNGATYNLAGQRVSGDYKGIVVKNGKKYLAK